MTWLGRLSIFSTVKYEQGTYGKEPRAWWEHDQDDDLTWFVI